MPGPQLPPRQTRAAKGKKFSKSSGEQAVAICEAEGLSVEVSAEVFPADLPHSVCLFCFIR